MNEDKTATEDLQVKEEVVDPLSKPEIPLYDTRGHRIRGTKINELKETLKLAREDFKVFLQIKIDEMTEEEKTANSELSIQKQMIIMGLVEELASTRRNKYSSRFFTWAPSGMNRQMRKKLTKMNRL